MERHADRKGMAADIRNELITAIKKTHGQIQTGERMTFADLARICERQFYKPANIVEGRKVSGVRGVATAKTHLNTLGNFFGKRLLVEITSESLLDYKLQRLSAKVENRSTNVRTATVNRELSTMRKMMRYALAQGWVLKDVFLQANVIDTAAEVERKRMLTLEEEHRLLDACEGLHAIEYQRSGKRITATRAVNNKHLKAMIILALDAGMRRGEIFNLRWEDIDFTKKMIRILGTHTKTERERIVPLSKRAESDLRELQSLSTSIRPFPYTDIKRSFATSKKIAGLDDLRFHDLRRTAVTRWIQQGNPIALAGKLAGHSQLQTTMKHYTAIDEQMVMDVTNKINDFHDANEKIREVETIN